MSDIQMVVAAILAGSLGFKGDTPSTAEGYVATYESVLVALRERDRAREKEKRAESSQEASWAAANADLQRKKLAISEPT